MVVCARKTAGGVYKRVLGTNIEVLGWYAGSALGEWVCRVTGVGWRGGGQDVRGCIGAV